MITRSVARSAAATHRRIIEQTVQSTRRTYASSEASSRHKAVYREIYPAMLRIGVVAMIVYYGLQVTWSHLYKQRLEQEMEQRVKELEKEVDERFNSNSNSNSSAALIETPKSWLASAKTWIGL